MMEAATLQTFDSGLNEDDHNALAVQFNPLAVELPALIKTADSIKVKTADDTAGILKARATRLALRVIRITVEKKRKELKEDALLRGRAVDGMANIVKAQIRPREKALQDMEDVAKLQEEKRVADLAATRAAELEPFDVDPSLYPLGVMGDDAYAALKQAMSDAHEARKAAEEKAIADELAAWKAQEEMAAQKDKERKALEAENARLKARAQAKENAERKAEQERLRVEAEELTAAQVLLQGPDSGKLKALDAALCQIVIPSVTSDVALDAIANVRNGLNSIVLRLRRAVDEMEG